MIDRYWTESPDWHGRLFTITDNGIVKVRKFLSDNDIVKQPNHDAVLELMAAIEAQAENELAGSNPN